MALFKKENENKEKQTSVKPAEIRAEKDITSVASMNFKSDILLRPRITEKGAILGESNSYAFEVHSSATKPMIAEAIKEVYNVVPERVRIVKIPSKAVVSRGRKGVKSGGKKAYVFLKKGDKIEVL
ncbi:MAG: 50S ribosomal protein L23 [Parcubacteria group bacterium CG11_big_fil_rev_8_21_14_0_20_39_22]|nr:MAG: 50S ribosomal protein L23 [Parcubacteria group bacterium CG11_big_fil_rev_8_21_14_0_20_39_22]